MEADFIQDEIIREFETIANAKNKYLFFRKIVEVEKAFSSRQAVSVLNKDGITEEIELHKTKVLLKGVMKDGKVYFSAQSNNSLIKGLVGLFVMVYSALTPDRVINANLYFANEIGLYDRLSPEWIQDMQTILQRIKAITATLNLKQTAR